MQIASHVTGLKSALEVDRETNLIILGAVNLAYFQCVRGSYDLCYAMHFPKQTNSGSKSFSNLEIPHSKFINIGKYLHAREIFVESLAGQSTADFR